MYIAHFIPFLLITHIFIGMVLSRAACSMLRNRVRMAESGSQDSRWLPISSIVIKYFFQKATTWGTWVFSYIWGLHFIGDPSGSHWTVTPRDIA